jgi:hypothetical protein
LTTSKAGDTLDEFLDNFPSVTLRSCHRRTGRSQGPPHQPAMKILIDENLPRNLVAHLDGHECRTVVSMRLVREEKR